VIFMGCILFAGADQGDCAPFTLETPASEASKRP
jgi:hypothetical protein